MPTRRQSTKPSPALAEPRACLPLVLLALVAAGAAGVLTWHHFGGIALPGCGAGGACDEAARSVLGRAPLVGWPMSSVGLAYFAALVAALIVARGRLARPLAIVIWIGAAWSLVMVGGLLQIRATCLYCLVVHGANLLLAVLSLRLGPSDTTPGTRWQMPAFGVSVIVLMAVLNLADSAATDRAKGDAEKALAASVDKIKQATAPAPTAPTPSSKAPAGAAPVAAASAPANGFTGRYRLGPERAAVRVVLFTDYQCPDCKRIDAELEALLSPGVSLSISPKMFPLNEDCNPNAPGDLHANACWAARAAQAAGIVGGPEAFWRMHRWLFERGGGFDDATLIAALPSLGLDAATFLPVMHGKDVNARILEDVNEGMALGISQTPMVFINGVELKGWNADHAVTRAVQAALTAAPADAGPEADHPPEAPLRFVADWREAAALGFDKSKVRHWIGPERSPVTVILFGDYKEPFTAEADGLLRVFTTGPEPNIRYGFVHYPVDVSCNNTTTMNLHPGACRAAAASEAAWALDGEEGFWRMHDWLMRNVKTELSDEVLVTAATECGLDPAKFMDAIAQPFIRLNVSADASMGPKVGLRSIPFIIVNDKPVARWKHEHENVLPRIINEAAGR